MTAVEVLGSVDELADGTGGSVDAVTGAAIGPSWKSRLKGKADRTAHGGNCVEKISRSQCRADYQFGKSV